MADNNSDQEKTEQPTPKKLRDAKKKGQVPRSKELNSMTVMVFGAIGFTREHILHRYTRRLWAWRDDFGNESEWAEQLGRRVIAAGADELWPMLAAR